LSKIADKGNYKKFFVTGFLILALISLGIFFLSSIYWIIAFFIIASIGAAFVEPIAEAYFFKIIHKTDENKYYAPFLTSLDVGGTIGRLIPALVIIFLAFNYMFLFLFFEMLFFVFIALTIKERKKKPQKVKEIIRKL
jgi:MFS family permease